MSDEIISQEEARALRKAMVAIEDILWVPRGEYKRRLKLNVIKEIVERTIQRKIEVEQ